MKSNRKSKLLFALGSFVWLVAISTGLGLVSRYANSAGARGGPPAEWPAESKVARIARLPTLLLFLHPHCPCSRATIGELAILMAHSQGLVQANAVFVKPAGFAENWEKTDLWASAASIPGVKVTIDDLGLEARKFRSLTSGQATLYSADGRLLFSGGITASRGHSGDNAGRTAIVSLLTEGTAYNPAVQTRMPHLIEAARNWEALRSFSGSVSHIVRNLALETAHRLVSPPTPLGNKFA